MLQTILVAFDGSEQSQKAFDLGLEIAAKFNARLLVIGIVRLPEPAISVEIDAMLDRGKTHFAEEFARLTEMAKEQSVQLEAEVGIGHPAEHILRFAEDNHADMIVMGRRGLSKLRGMLVGSVSERVVRHAGIPVFLAS